MQRKSRSFLSSLSDAVKGLLYLFKNERNAQIHLLAAVLVIGAGLYFEISTTHWSILCLTIGVVIMAEGFNTAIEKTADLISTEINPKIEKIKDVSAGAVLMVSVAALAIAGFIFLPYMLVVFN